jgi:adenylate cyclase
MTDSPTPRPERTILFVDVCDSTQLYETLGDERAAKAIMGCLTALRGECEKAGGRVVQRIGDELMCVFETADAALRAASDMQEWVARTTTGSTTPVSVRIGCHAGPVLESAEELFGDAVNVAARVAAFAAARQILTTQDTREKASAGWRAQLRPLGSFTVRGKREELTIHELVWRESETLTELGVVLAAPRSAARLVLRYAGQEIRLDSRERISLTIGRSPGSGLVVHEPRASRCHGRIETRQGKFVLVDQSANGTFVRIAPDENVVLRHEELILYAHGTIGLGQEAHEGRIEFSCEGAAARG